MPVEEPPQGADAGAHTPRFQRRLDLGKRDVAIGLDQTQDRAPLRLDRMGSAVTAERLRLQIAPFTLQRPPAAHARGTHPETIRRFAV